MARNWELLLEFKVHGAGRTLYGDGFAMWYVAEGNLKPGKKKEMKRDRERNMYCLLEKHNIGIFLSPYR